VGLKNGCKVAHFTIYEPTESWTLVPERLLPPSLGLSIPWACPRSLAMTLDNDWPESGQGPGCLFGGVAPPLRWLHHLCD